MTRRLNHHAEYPRAMRWLYDPDAKLIGEHVYQIGETKYTKLDPANDVTMWTHGTRAVCQGRRVTGARFSVCGMSCSGPMIACG